MNPTNEAIVVCIAELDKYFSCVHDGTHNFVLQHPDFDVLNTVDGDEGLIDASIRLERMLEHRAESNPNTVETIIALYEKYLGGRWKWDEKWKQFYKERDQHARKTKSKTRANSTTIPHGCKKN